MTYDPDYGAQTIDENDPRNDDPLDCELTDDDDMDDAEREARLREEHEAMMGDDR